MFVTIVFFPSVFLQANVIITIQKEKLDMICNLMSLAINVIFSVVGLMYFRNMTTINLALLFSILIFHFIQDLILIKSKLTNSKNVTLYYISCFTFILLYFFISNSFMQKFTFPAFIITLLIFVIVFRNKISFFIKK